MLNRPTLALFAANAVGMVVFLRAASHFWIEPEVADVPGANVGNAFGWIVFAAPISLVFIIGSMVWIINRTRRADASIRLQGAAFMFTVLIAWTAVFLVDSAHHGV